MARKQGDFRSSMQNRDLKIFKEEKQLMAFKLQLLTLNEWISNLKHSFQNIVKNVHFSYCFHDKWPCLEE